MNWKINHKWLAISALLILIPGCSLFYPGDVTSYANDIGVSYAEAKYRLSIQMEIALLNSELQKDTENFGGLYIEHLPEYSVNVLYKDINSREKLDAYIADKSWRNKVKVHQVNYSSEELRRAQKEAGDIVTQLGVKYSSGINIKQSTVNINVQNKKALGEKLYAKGIKLPSSIKIIEVKAFSVPE